MLAIKQEYYGFNSMVWGFIVRIPQRRDAQNCKKEVNTFSGYNRPPHLILRSLLFAMFIACGIRCGGCLSCANFLAEGGARPKGVWWMPWDVGAMKVVA